MKINSPINLYRLFLFIVTFISIVLNNNDFYTIIKLLIGTICLIFILTYKELWIKKKNRFIIYYFNVFIFYGFNLLFLFFIFINIFN